MKVTLDRELFLMKLQKAIKFVPTKTLIPAFDNIMLTMVSDSVISMQATNGNTQVRMECQVMSGDPAFSVCVPARLLLKTINLFGENKVILTLKQEDVLELKCGKSKYNIGLDCFPKDFPKIPMTAVTSEINMQQFNLRIGLKSSEKFVDEDSQNANMVAINIAEINNKIVFTGLTQISMCRSALKPISINKWDTVSIPTDCATKVISILGDKGEIGIAHNGTHISFFTDKDSPEAFDVISTVANIKFPNTEKLFSQKPEMSYIVNTMEFLSAVKRLKLYSSKLEANTVNVLANDGDEMVLTSSDSLTKKSGEESMSFTNSTKTPIDKNFGHENLIQILSSVETNEFTLYYSEKQTAPSFIIPKVNTEDEDIFSFLIAAHKK